MSDESGARPGNIPPELSVLRRRTPMDVDWIEVDGVHLRYGIRRGRGRPVLLLSAQGSGLDSMSPLVDALDDIEVLGVDLPGTGASPALTVPRGMGWHARLLQRMLDRLGYDRPINIVGLSWGGSLAQAFALAYPQRTNRLVLASSSVGIGRSALGKGPLKRLKAMARRTPREDDIGDRMMPSHDRPAGPEGRAGTRRLPVEAALYEPSARGYFNQSLAGLAWTSAHRAHQLMCPTLILGGDDDPISPLVNSRLLYWLIPKSHLHVVRGGGHLFLLLRANESAAVIRRFINERRYDGTDNTDYYRACGLGPDGRIVPQSPGTDSAGS